MPRSRAGANKFVMISPQVWPGLVHYPDWLHPNVSHWWTHEIMNSRQMVPVDGLWIDMNEPSNFCDGLCISRWIQQPADYPNQSHGVIRR